MLVVRVHLFEPFAQLGRDVLHLVVVLGVRSEPLSFCICVHPAFWRLSRWRVGKRRICRFGSEANERLCLETIIRLASRGRDKTDVALNRIERAQEQGRLGARPSGHVDFW